MRRWLKLPAALLLAGALVGCGAVGGAWEYFFGEEVRIDSIGITVLEKANNNSPVPVDLVFIGKREPLANEFAKITAADWFARRQQFLRDFPEDIDVRSYEVVPGQILPVEKVEKPKVRAAGFIFVNYAAPGAHRYRITTERDVKLVLDQKEFTVQP
jgi:type VI secretion system protein